MANRCPYLNTCVRFSCFDASLSGFHVVARIENQFRYRFCALITTVARNFKTVYCTHLAGEKKFLPSLSVSVKGRGPLLKNADIVREGRGYQPEKKTRIRGAGSTIPVIRGSRHITAVSSTKFVQGKSGLDDFFGGEYSKPLFSNTELFDNAVFVLAVLSDDKTSTVRRQCPRLLHFAPIRALSNFSFGVFTQSSSTIRVISSRSAVDLRSKLESKTSAPRPLRYKGGHTVHDQTGLTGAFMTVGKQYKCRCFYEYIIPMNMAVKTRQTQTFWVHHDRSSED